MTQRRPTCLRSCGGRAASAAAAAPWASTTTTRCARRWPRDSAGRHADELRGSAWRCGPSRPRRQRSCGRRSPGTAATGQLDTGARSRSPSGEPAEDPGGTAHAADGDGRRADFPHAEPLAHLGTVPAAIGPVDRSLVLVPQYPLTEREIAQAWRRLRRRRRSGPAVELDVTATLEQHSHYGVATPPVLVPRRRNTAQLLLLIDRFGSMTPFHGYVDHIVRAIRNAGRFDDVRAVYFHDLPGGSRRPFGTPARSTTRSVRPGLGAPAYRADERGSVYDDPALTIPHRLGRGPRSSRRRHGRRWSSVTRARPGSGSTHAAAGHGRAGQGLACPAATTWLNPVPPDRWPRTTAAAATPVHARCTR